MLLEPMTRNLALVEGEHGLPRIFPCSSSNGIVERTAITLPCVSTPSLSTVPITVWQSPAPCWKRSRPSSPGSATVTCGPLLALPPFRRWLDPRSHGGQDASTALPKTPPRMAVFLMPPRALRTSGTSSTVWGAMLFLPGTSFGRTDYACRSFNDQEMVALIGAHAVGRCHPDRSGFDGPWTFSPTTFTNDFYKLLFDEKYE